MPDPALLQAKEADCEVLLAPESVEASQEDCPEASQEGQEREIKKDGLISIVTIEIKSSFLMARFWPQ